MAIEIGALRALLSLDSAAFDRGAKRAQASMTGLQRSLTKAAGHMNKVGRSMSTRVTAPFVAATGLMVRSSLSTIDAQAKFAQSLGTTTASIQTLTRAADMAGISQGELEGSLRRMTRRISLAEQGAGAGAKAFARLGIEAADLADLDAADRIRLIQKRIAELIPTAEQAAVASQVFGDQTGLAMLRLDAATIDAAAAEVGRFGVAVSDVDADRIEEANDAMSALGLVSRGLGNQLAVALAPTLKAVANGIADVAAWFSNLSPRMKTFLGGAVGVAAAIGPLAVTLGFVATGLAALAAPIGLVVLGFGAIAGVAAAVAMNWDSLIERFPALGVAAERAGDAFGAWWAGAQETTGHLVGAVKGAVSGIVALFEGDLSGALDGFRDAWASVGDMLQSYADAWLDIIEALVPGFSGWVDEIIATVTALPDRLYDYGANAIQRFVDGMKARWDTAKDSVLSIFRLDEVAPALSANGPLGQMRGVGADLSSGLADGIRSGQPGVEGAAADAVAGAEGKAREVSETRSPSRVWMRLGRDLMEGLGNGIADNAQVAARSAADAARRVTGSTDAAFDEGAARVEGYYDQIGSAAAGAIMQGQSFADAMRGVFQQVASDFISSGVSDLLGGLFGKPKIGGGLFSDMLSSFGGFFADGGTLGAGQWGIAGENGPEPIVGPAHVIPTHQLGAANAAPTRIEVIPSPYFDVRVADISRGTAAPMVSGAANATRRAHGVMSNQYFERGTMSS